MPDLIEILPATHDVELEIAYATGNNFTGKPVYSRAACYLIRMPRAFSGGHANSRGYSAIGSRSLTPSGPPKRSSSCGTTRRTPNFWPIPAKARPIRAGWRSI